MTVEAPIELLIWLVLIGMFGALESASKLLATELPAIEMLPATLDMLEFTIETGSDAWHAWFELIAVNVGSVEMLAPLQTT